MWLYRPRPKVTVCELKHAKLAYNCCCCCYCRCCHSTAHTVLDLYESQTGRSLTRDLMRARVAHVSCTFGDKGRAVLIRLHKEQLYALYFSPNIIRVIKSRRLRWAGHVARKWERRGAYRVSVGKTEGRRPLGRPRRRWKHNIKTHLRKVGGTWTGSIWLRLGTGGGLL
jgi:hypothetical protein